MGKTQMIDIDETIANLENQLAEMRKLKEIETKKNYRKSFFKTLPESIENIAAHISLRENKKIVILFDSHDEEFRFIHDDGQAFGDYGFDDDGNIWGFTCDQYFPITDSESVENFTKNFFGCVITPKNGEYTIDSFLIDENNCIVLPED